MINIENQFYVAVLSFFFGVFLDFVYEFHSSLGYFLGIRGSKFKENYAEEAKGSNVRRIIYGIWDMVYFLCITPVCAIFLYGTNYGIVRWYIVLSVFLGFGASKLSLGRIESYFLDNFIYAYKKFVLIKIKRLLQKIVRIVKKNKKDKEKNQNKSVIISINGKQGC